MIIRTGPNRFRSPTALGAQQPSGHALFNGAGGEALFESFGRYGAIQMPPIFATNDPEVQAIRDQMQLAMDDMDALFWKTGVILKLMPLDLQTFLRRMSPLGYVLLKDEEVSDTAASVLKTYRDLGDRITYWKNALYNAVWHGKTQADWRGPSIPFDIKKWKELGEVYANQARSIGNLAIDNGFFANVLQSIRELPDDIARVAGDLKDLGTPALWPTWLKVTAGIAAVAGVAYVLNSFTGAARAVRGR